MKKFFSLVLFCLAINNSFSQIDSFSYYSLIDTNQLFKYIEKKHNISSNPSKKQWIYNFYKINYYIVRRHKSEATKILKYLYQNSNIIKSNYYLQNLTFYKMWLFTLTDSKDSIDFYLNRIIKNPDVSDSLKVRSLNTVSFYYAKKNISKAAKLLYKAIDIGLKDSLPELYHTFLNLSAIYLNLNLISNAKEYLEIGAKFKRKNSNPILNYLYIFNENVILYTEHRLDEALKNFKEIYNFMIKYNLTEYAIGATINISRSFYYLNQLDSSYYYATNILPIIQKDTLIKNKEYLASYYWLLSDLYINKNKDSAFLYLQKTLKEANLPMIPEVYKDISEFYYNKKQLDSAYKYAVFAYSSQIKNLDTLKTTIISQYANKIELLNMALNKKDLEIKLLKSENEKKRIKDSLIYIIVLFILLILLVFLSIRNIHIHRLQKLKEKFNQDLINYQEKMNQQISMNLHDNIGQSLVLLSKNNIIQENNDLLIKINDIIQNVRHTSHEIFPAHLINNSIEEAINRLIHETEKNSNFVIVKEIDSSINNMTADKSLHLYRIIQELISNSLKYCKGNLIKLKIEKNKNSFILTYKDYDDKATNTKIKPGFGIHSIMLRTRILNGKIDYWFDKGFNTKITF
jgi:signal transduction histidine kinase